MSYLLGGIGMILSVVAATALTTPENLYQFVDYHELVTEGMWVLYPVWFVMGVIAVRFFSSPELL